MTLLAQGHAKRQSLGLNPGILVLRPGVEKRSKTQQPEAYLLGVWGQPLSSPHHFFTLLLSVSTLPPGLLALLTFILRTESRGFSQREGGSGCSTAIKSQAGNGYCRSLSFRLIGS